MRPGAPEPHWSADIPVRQSLANHRADRNVRAPSFGSLLLGAFALGLLLPPPALAQNTITNIMSPIASYQYAEAFSTEALTNGGIQSPIASVQYLQDFGSAALTNGGINSPIVSYQYLENFSSAALTNGGIMSPIASYQYYEWPGNGILNLLSSPVVSYYYPAGGASAAVSASFSRVVVSPGSLPADGQSVATVTVGLLDGNGNPVAGKWVSVSVVEQLSAGGVATLSTVTQPASPTDNNGQTTASFTSTAPGTAIVSAQDVTDGVALQQPTVRFTSGLVAPSPALSNAIVQLGNSTSNLLVNSIATIALEEGGHGDYFQANVLSDNAEQELSALGTFVGSITPLLHDEGLIIETAKSIGIDLTFYAAGDAVDAIVGSSTGLTRLGQGVASTNASYERALLPRQQSIAAGVPPACSQYVADYTNDLALRLQANNAIKTLLSSQDDLLLDLQENSAVSHVDLLTPLFMDINVVGTLAGAALTPVGSVLAAEALNFSEGLVSYGANQRNLNKDQNGYNSAMASLIDCSCFSGLIYSNTASAFDAIAQGRQPKPITGSVVSVDSVKTYEPLSGITGTLIDWAGLALANTEYVHVTGAYSQLTIRNTSQQTAAFNLNAFYWHTISINDEVGDVLGSMTAPLVLTVNTNLAAGHSAQVTLNYFDGVNGAAPDDGSAITITALGYDGNNGIYWVDQRSSTIQWQATGNAVPGPIVKPDGGPIGSNDATNLFGLETPIKSRVILNPSNQTYQAQIWVANPFAIPLVATVTQSLPAGLTVLTTDGVLSGGAIAWTNSIPTNGLVMDSFTFTLAVAPGAQTNLPGATVVFRDSTPTNSLTMQSAPPAFTGLLPVQVAGSVPTGVSGQAAGMPVGVTNLSTTTQAGMLVVSVTDLSGNAVTNFSQSFELGSGRGTNLGFSLPGTWAPGSYLVTGSLNINGGTEQVLTGVYIVPPAPAAFGYGPAGGVLTNGFTLMLQGSAGFGYLIEASTNLVDWQPVQYVVAASSPTYFTDYYAPYYNQRFYRAVPLSQVQPPVVPQFGAVRLVPGGGVQLTLTGGVGQTYNVEASTNLVNWVAVTNLVLSTGTGQFTDYSATNCPQRFYRAVVP
jgi:hypothetical protein